MKSAFVLAGAVALSASAAFADKKPITSALHCWSVGALSYNAAQVTVAVGFYLREDGTVQASSMRMVEAKNGSDAEKSQAFEAAKRAILRCGTRGYAGTGPKVLSFGPDGVSEVRKFPIEV